VDGNKPLQRYQPHLVVFAYRDEVFQMGDSFGGFLVVYQKVGDHAVDFIPENVIRREALHKVFRLFDAVLIILFRAVCA